MIAVGQHNALVLLIILYYHEVVQSVESVDEIPRRNHSNECLSLLGPKGLSTTFRWSCSLAML